MTMTIKEFGILKKAMSRTTSDNDAEALVSLRAANRLLATHNLTWDQVFARVVTVVNEVIDSSDEDDDSLFEAALSGASGSFRDMLLDIYAKHQRGVKLTERQWTVVCKAAGR